MNSSYISRAFAGVAMVAIVASTGTAMAQTPADQNGASVSEDIIVTARRKDERLQDVPTTINAVTADAIDKLNLREFRDIQNVVPGLQLTNASNGFSAGATVRGVKFDIDTGGLPAVEFYLNDAPMESNILFAAMYDVGQVELLRGPQGTLRGRASPSGSITVTSRKPNLKDVGAYVSGTVNSNSGRNVHGAVNIPLIDDVLAVRLAGFYDRNEANRTYSVNSSASPYARTESYRASVRFEPTDNISANFLYQSTDRRQRGFNQLASISFFDATQSSAPAYIDPFQRQAITDGFRSNIQRFDVMTWNADWRFAGQKLSYVGSRSVQHIRGVSQYDQANALTGTTPRTLTDPAGFQPVCSTNQALFGFGATNGDFYQCTDIRQTQDTHELRLSSDERVLGMFSYVVGGMINHVSQSNYINQETAIRISPSFLFFDTSATARPGRRNEHSLFGNITAYIGDATELSGGLRYIDYEESSDFMVRGTAQPSYLSRSEAVIYTGSLKHDFTRDIMAYATVGSSWRPGLNVIGNLSARRSALEQSFITTAPEKSTSYEVGVKTSWLNRRLTVNASAFHQDFTNYGYRGGSIWYINYSTPTAIPDAARFNFVAAVPVKVDGFEIETNFQATRRWNVGATFSYANGRVTGGRIACTDLNGDGVPDANPGAVTVAQLPATDHVSACNYSGPSNTAPKWSMVVQSEYAVPVSDRADAYLRGLFNLYPSYGQDPSYSFDDVRAYSQLNLYAGLRSPKGAWELSLFAKNLLNTQRVLSATNGGVTSTIRSATASQTIGTNYLEVTTTAPREFGLNLRLAFGSR
ncbi:TonB-dependent receptor plug domain-containing protein [Sphingobium sufflavum]|uniref:TonB-dependent receptor n=1 Tax=Sphingobium sufflavum TaxID=1129547 RepID=UPI001F1BC61B|nr:TonB-dependent receptor plug domain-containing protein [Sphingobium sufflavum]MCE7798291.1 TonB-dependent receptor plug domain-containing protein [Sphingobium sufflavum]